MMSDEKAKATWGSWEELLLACAVKRHGFKNWDSVAMELQTKTSLPRLLTTAQCCRQKFHDLKRRFSDHNKLDDNINIDINKINIPWLDQLRKVRVDELKQDLQRYDLSILSLQLKVKRLEEERDLCLDDTISGQQKPDLDCDKKLDESVKVEEPVRVSKLLVSGEESDRENRSANGSNSTGLSHKIGGGGDGGELVIKAETVPVTAGSGGEGPVESGSKEEEEEEFGDSVTQLSSDVQSSTSFGSKRMKTTSSNNFNSNFNSIIIKRSGSTSTASDAKSQPLIRLLQMIRTHRHASLFQRPGLNDSNQEWNKYKEVIRQHVDIETIQTRVEGGSYGVLTFYRDLLLLLNNAIVYFPKASLESETALQLRNLVTTEIKRDTNHTSDSSSQEQDLVVPSLQLPPPPQPQALLERTDSLLAKHKSSSPIIVCRKRSSVSSKPASSLAQNGNFKQQQNDDDGDKKPDATDLMKQRGVERSLLKARKEEKAIITTGTRSSRRSGRNLTGNAPNTPSISNKKKQNSVKGSKDGAAAAGSVDNKQETTSKRDNKKEEEEEEETRSRSDKKKSVVDFLKRIKKNSPVQTVKKSSGRSTGSEEQKKNNNSGRKKDKDKGKERIILLRRGAAKEEINTNTSPSKRSVGRPSKTKNTAVSGKRRRESGGKEEEVEAVVAKPQSKRARR